MEVIFYVGKKYYAGCEKIGGGSSCDVESASFVLSEKRPAAKATGHSAVIFYTISFVSCYTLN